MRIVWLASYPKSGNTWVRFLLYTLLYGPPARSMDVTARIPDLHRASRIQAPTAAPLFAKTHFPCSPRHPKIAETDRAVHILRHPKDVLLSALNHGRMTSTGDTRLPARTYAEMFIKAGGDPAGLDQGFGTWASHAESWTAGTPFPVLTVRYEDLKRDTAAVLRAITGFCSIETTDDKIDAAVRASTFDQLRALEVREKANPAKNPESQSLFRGDRTAARAGHFFINAGKTGQKLDPLAPGLDAKFDAAFKDALERFGYAD